MTLPAGSGFWAMGRMTPYILTRFNVQEVQVAPHTRVEAFVDCLAVWSKSGSTFARSVEESRDLLALIVAAYALRTGVALDFTFTSWVEATNARFDGTMIGVAVDRRGHRAMMSPTCRKSQDMRAAIELAAATHHAGGWRLAVRASTQRSARRIGRATTASSSRTGRSRISHTPRLQPARTLGRTSIRCSARARSGSRTGRLR